MEISKMRFKSSARFETAFSADSGGVARQIGLTRSYQKRLSDLFQTLAQAARVAGRPAIAHSQAESDETGWKQRQYNPNRNVGRAKRFAPRPQLQGTGSPACIERGAAVSPGLVDQP
ncbi:hypothetical protein GGE45_001261 [Rhizobium aethiopicum]|uniref:Uncharacterized protein n=1 Tax=Rhizobium aethiopicum TaxID=1138170 RepID=A0A7W6MFY6_9HYPH|nr:hypothetical protein [Rhizobium aethiopicum]MBB4192010.1 hypothetical protein [Rhizobium aethiopicum]MBB4578941.1 hypothetical protein [Rhizobium aethiopicum]